MNLLFLSEYFYNAAKNAKTKTSLFMIYNERQLISFQLHSYKSKIATNAKEMTQNIVALQEELTQRITKTQNDQARYYDKNHKSLELKVSSKIMLKVINLKIERLCKKLDHRFLSLYKIIQRIELQFYKLKLSASHKMHSMFHISLLKSYRENTIDKRTSFSSLSVEAVTEKEVNERKYEIDQILKSKRHYEKIKYYVK